MRLLIAELSSEHQTW